MNTNQKPVEYFSASRIKIEIEGQQIIWRNMTIEINSRIGEHTTGKITYIASKNQLNLYKEVLLKVGEASIIISGRSNVLSGEGEIENKIFLNGIIEDIDVEELFGGGLKIILDCVSKSILLDRIPRYRSFQDTKLTYENIAEEINKNYEEKLVSVGEDMKKVPRMTIQYNETDWEYLKRVASYVGEPIIAYYDKVLVGFFRNRPVLTPNIRYSDFCGASRKRRKFFKIRGTEVYSVSNRVKLKTRDLKTGELMENDYFIVESKIYNVGNELKCEYFLGKETDYFVDPIPHTKIRGAIIEARVMHVARTDESNGGYGMEDGSTDNLEGRKMGSKPLNLYIAEEQEKSEDRYEEVKKSDIAVMTLDLTEGLTKNKEKGQGFRDEYAGKCYFPYVTPYSQTNTGFAPAPEPNDRVALQFTSENETEAIVTGAISNNGNGRFSNPENRNYHVGESDFNMTLAKDSLSTSAASSISQSASSISESAETISNNAKNYSEIIEGNKTLVAGNVSQVSRGNTNIQSNGDTEVNSSGFSVVNGGKNVLING